MPRAGSFKPITTPGRKPGPPSYLSPEAKKVWCEIIGARPWNWFSPEQFPTLADYCRVVVEGEWYARALTEIGDPTQLTAEEDVDRYRWYSREDRALTALKSSLANKLRLTIRSQRATSVPLQQSFSVPVGETAPRPPDADAAPPRRPIPVGPIPPWHPFSWESTDEEWAEYERNLAAAGVPSGPMGMPANEEAAPQEPPREEDGDR
jgi:hypothetical protein